MFNTITKNIVKSENVRVDVYTEMHEDEQKEEPKYYKPLCTNMNA